LTELIISICCTIQKWISTPIFEAVNSWPEAGINISVSARVGHKERRDRETQPRPVTPHWDPANSFQHFEPH